jgi:hypothetical protein
MADRDGWEDRELNGDDDDSSSSSSWEESSRNWLPWALWALIPVGLGLLWFSLRGGGETLALPTKTPSPESAAPEGSPPEEAREADEAVKLPPLAESDPFLRKVLAKLTSHPVLALFLEADDLVRKIVVSVANVAEGVSPAKQLLHIRPEERFSTLETSARIVVDPGSYHRYDALAELFASLDARAVAGLYRTLEPLFEEAHKELGLSERRGFPDTLTRAFAVLLAVPVVEGPIRLRAVNVNYAFEDPALEKLSPAQKHLVRMGPENTRKVQRKLTEIQAALGLR